MQKRTAPQEKDSKQNTKTPQDVKDLAAGPVAQDAKAHDAKSAQKAPQAQGKSKPPAPKTKEASNVIENSQESPDKEPSIKDKESRQEPQKKASQKEQAQGEKQEPAAQAQAAKAARLSVEQIRSLEQEKAIGSLKGRTSMLTALSVLLLLGLGGGAFYGLDALNALKAQNQELKQTLSGYEQTMGQLNSARESLIASHSQIEALANQNRSLMQANASMKDQTDALSARLHELMQKDIAVQESLSKVNARLDEFEGRNPDDWRIAQSYFCINQAYSKAVYGHDLKAALWNLKQGDLILVNIEDEQVLKIRRAIASDIAALEQIPALDLFGTRAKIEALLESTDKLTLKGYMDDYERSQAFSADAAPSSDLAQWKENLLTSVKEFSSRFVEVRRKTPDAESDFVSPSQDQFLRANIKSRLLMALQSVDNQDEKAYVACLSEAIRMVGAYFAEDKPSTSAFIKSAQELLCAPIAADLPDTLQSYALFAALMQERLRGGAR